MHICKEGKVGNVYTPQGDFIILELVDNGTFEHFPVDIDTIGIWDEYLKIGLDESGKLMCDRGVIRKKYG